MHPQTSHRFISAGNDIIFETKHYQGYSRICIPKINQGFVKYITQFCNFYKCNFSKNTFKQQSEIYKTEAIELFEQNFNNTLINKAYLHRKINLCDIGLNEDWHSPVFVIKYNSHIIATTGHNKIYATALRKRNFNLDFDCFVFDYDKTDPTEFINVDSVVNDDDFANKLNSDDFAIDISIEKTIAGFVPAIMQYSKHYPIKYHDGSYELSTLNKRFFDKNKSTSNNLRINVIDKYNSSITSTTNIFKISSKESNLTFATIKRISFDLSDLLPFLTPDVSTYTDSNNSYILIVNNAPQKEKIICPAKLM